MCLVKYILVKHSETDQLSGKEKVLGAAVGKESYASKTRKDLSL